MYKTLLTVTITLFSFALRAEDYNVFSPDGHLKATVRLVDGKLSYSVSRDGRTIVNESPLGLKFSNTDFTEDIELVSVDSSLIDDAYTLPVGKRSQYRDYCHTLSVTTLKKTWKQRHWRFVLRRLMKFMETMPMR